MLSPVATTAVAHAAVTSRRARRSPAPDGHSQATNATDPTSTVMPANPAKRTAPNTAPSVESPSREPPSTSSIRAWSSAASAPASPTRKVKAPPIGWLSDDTTRQATT